MIRSHLMWFLSMTKREVTKYFSCTMEKFFPYVAHRAMVSELKWIFSNFCIRSHVSYVGCRIVDIWHRSRGNFETLCTQRSVFTGITIVLSDTPGGFILMWREIKHSLYTVQKLSETEISAHQARKLKPTKTRIHPEQFYLALGHGVPLRHSVHTDWVVQWWPQAWTAHS